jgi:hypothetical protein
MLFVECQINNEVNNKLENKQIKTGFHSSGWKTYEMGRYNTNIKNLMLVILSLRRYIVLCHIILYYTLV